MKLGLSGYAQSGKDTVGSLLVQGYGFERLAYGDLLRDMAYTINPIVTSRLSLREGDVYLQHFVDTLGWEEAKKMPEVRRILQKLGTKGTCDVLGRDVLVNALMSPIVNVGSDVVITDVRKPWEAQAIEDCDGFVLRVKRPGVGPANDHSSETMMDDWPFDAVINNTGSVNDLWYVVDLTLAELKIAAQ